MLKLENRCTYLKTEGRDPRNSKESSKEDSKEYSSVILRNPVLSLEIVSIYVKRYRNHVKMFMMKNVFVTL